MPTALSGERARQNVPSIRGTTYQAWWSIDAWLQISSADEAVFVEGAEDYDVVLGEGAVTVQVRDHVAPISLGSSKARDAIENYWKLCAREPGRAIDYHYLTSSDVAVERDASFDGMSGIEAWRAAQTSESAARAVAQYLAPKFSAGSLRSFLETGTPRALQETLFRRFVWLTNQGDFSTVQRSIDNRIAALLVAQNRSLSLIATVRKYLESRYWEVVRRDRPDDRRLDLLELHQQITEATSIVVVIQAENVLDFIDARLSGGRLAELLLGPVPAPPSPLLPRPHLVQQVERIVAARTAALLFGTVYKGKSTLAQLAAQAILPSAWWLDVRDRTGEQLDLLFHAVAERLTAAEGPSLLIVDDLDLTPATYARCRHALSLLLHRAHTSGRSVIITSRGSLEHAPLWPQLPNVASLEVGEIGDVETRALCAQLGCPQSRVEMWAPLVQATTYGHPALVQVRLEELARRGWPEPSVTDFTTPSSAVRSVKQVTRELLASTVSSQMAEFMYTLAEATIPLRRETAVLLQTWIEPEANAGDQIDALTGRWIENLGKGWLRATALLRNVASEVWPPSRVEQAHVRLHDAIRARGVLSPAEAASLFLHAFLARSASRLALAAMQLQLAEGDEARRQVEKNLLWLPLVGLEAGQQITPDAFAAAAARALQFRVALTLDSEYVAQICARWEEEVERIDHEVGKQVARAFMWLTLSSAESSRVPLPYRLSSISRFRATSADAEGPRVVEMLSEVNRRVGMLPGLQGTPRAGSPTQTMLVLACRYVRGLDGIGQLRAWLEGVDSVVHGEVDAIIEWPIVQQLGAFVQTAWSAGHEVTTDWNPWITELDQHLDLALRTGMRAYGREAVKAKAILLTEYLDRSDEALRALSWGVEHFGSSPILLEQEANVRFQRRDDSAVLELWESIRNDPNAKAALDPFAYRRVAISAARLGNPELASRVFLQAGASIAAGEFVVTKFGLTVDASYCYQLAGELKTAAGVLEEAAHGLPSEARAEGDPRWEAAQRVASEVCRIVEYRAMRRDVQPKIDVGSASSPSMIVERSETGQQMRTDLLQATALRLAVSLGVKNERFAQAIESLANSETPLVRFAAARAALAHGYQTGATNGFVRAVESCLQSTMDLRPIVDASSQVEISELVRQATGFFIVGLACAEDPVASVFVWAQDASANSLVSSLVRSLSDDFQATVEQSEEELWAIARRGTGTVVARCIAARLLLRAPRPPETVFALQSLLVSGALIDAARGQQGLFSHSLARRLLPQWRQFSENPFALVTPRRSVPAIQELHEQLERGMATAGSVMAVAAMATGKTLRGSLTALE